MAEGICHGIWRAKSIDEKIRRVLYIAPWAIDVRVRGGKRSRQIGAVEYASSLRSAEVRRNRTRSICAHHAQAGLPERASVIVGEVSRVHQFVSARCHPVRPVVPETD